MTKCHWLPNSEGSTVPGMQGQSSEKPYIGVSRQWREKEGRIYPESVSPWPKTHSRVVIPQGITLQRSAQVAPRSILQRPTPPSQQGGPWWRRTGIGRRETLPRRACMELVRARAELAVVVAGTRTGRLTASEGLRGGVWVQKVREEKWHVLGSHSAPGHFQVIPNTTLVPTWVLLRLGHINEIAQNPTRQGGIHILFYPSAFESRNLDLVLPMNHAVNLFELSSPFWVSWLNWGFWNSIRGVLTSLRIASFYGISPLSLSTSPKISASSSEDLFWVPPETIGANFSFI